MAGQAVWGWIHALQEAIIVGVAIKEYCHQFSWPLQEPPARPPCESGLWAQVGIFCTGLAFWPARWLLWRFWTCCGRCLRRREAAEPPQFVRGGWVGRRALREPVAREPPRVTDLAVDDDGADGRAVRLPPVRRGWGAMAGAVARAEGFRERQLHGTMVGSHS